MLDLRLLFAAGLSVGFCVCRSSETTQLASLPKDVRRVVFLGDSITYAGSYVSDVEAYFATRHPFGHLEFINVGLPSETTSGLSEEGHAGGQFPRPVLEERIGRVLAQLKPDLVFACYGMNDGIYLKFDPLRFLTYRAGIELMRREVHAANSRIILLTPPFFDALRTNNQAYVDTLDRYSRWLVEQRRDGWRVIDVHTAMTQDIERRRRSYPDYSYASDGVHPNETGHWIIAKEILKELGARDVDAAESAEEMVAVAPHGKDILALVSKREELMKDAWLTQTGHTRPGMNKGLPFVDAQRQAAQIEKQIERLLKDSMK